MARHFVLFLNLYSHQTRFILYNIILFSSVAFTGFIITITSCINQIIVEFEEDSREELLNHLWQYDLTQFA